MRSAASARARACRGPLRRRRAGFPAGQPGRPSGREGVCSGTDGRAGVRSGLPMAARNAAFIFRRRSRTARRRSSATAAKAPSRAVTGSQPEPMPKSRRARGHHCREEGQEPGYRQHQPSPTNPERRGARRSNRAHPRGRRCARPRPRCAAGRVCALGADHGFLLLRRHFHNLPRMWICWFHVNDVRQEFACRLQLVAPVPENVRRHPHDPERNSNDKDHRAAKREVHTQNRMRYMGCCPALSGVCRARSGDWPASGRRGWSGGHHGLRPGGFSATARGGLPALPQP